MKTQNAEVLAHLKRRSLTQADAIMFGCYRLAARVYDLCKAGYQIRTEREAHEGGVHARYRLERK